MAKPRKVEDIRDYEVYNIKTGARGFVTEIDPLTITIAIGNHNKSYTHRTFNKWWVIVPQEKPVPTEEEEEEFIDNYIIEYDRWDYPCGKPGVGKVLRTRFMKLVKDLDMDEVVSYHYPKSNMDVIKYNGYTILEIRKSKRRLTIMANEDSITPMNKKKIYNIVPKDWYWTLNARFIFTKINQWPLMQSILLDGLYFRKDQWKEEQTTIQNRRKKDGENSRK